MYVFIYIFISIMTNIFLHTSHHVLLNFLVMESWLWKSLLICLNGRTNQIWVFAINYVHKLVA